MICVTHLGGATVVIAYGQGKEKEMKIHKNAVIRNRQEERLRHATRLKAYTRCGIFIGKSYRRDRWTFVTCKNCQRTRV